MKQCDLTKMGRIGAFFLEQQRWWLCAGMAATMHVAVFHGLPATTAKAREDAPIPPTLWLETSDEPIAERSTGGSTDRDPEASSARQDPAENGRSHSRAWRAPVREKQSAQPFREIREVNPKTEPRIESDNESSPLLLAADSSAAEPAASAVGAGEDDASRGGVGGSSSTGRSGGGLRGEGQGFAGTGEEHGTRPRLFTSTDPCAGYFPRHAHVPAGEVRLAVWVDATGHARVSQVIAERPLREGFGPAARGCVEKLRFAPARDDHGMAVPGRAELRIRFRRRS